jgi:hypothetical protein
LLSFLIVYNGLFILNALVTLPYPHSCAAAIAAVDHPNLPDRWALEIWRDRDGLRRSRLMVRVRVRVRVRFRARVRVEG